MDYNSKRSIVSRALYIILGIMMITVISITLYAVWGQNASQQEEDPAPFETGIEPETTAVENVLAAPEDPVETELPVMEEDIPDESNEEVLAVTEVPAAVEEPQVSVPVYRLPVQGSLGKLYTIDTPVYSLTMNDYRVHTGIDITANVGAPVYAFTNGTVQEIYVDPMMGNCMSIAHENGLVSYYMNLSEMIPQNITVGTVVESGQIIGGVGETSLVELAENSHVHFELKENGESIDPLQYFDNASFTEQYGE